MKAFSDAIASGVMANLNELRLDDNQIGDDGMKAFSTAIGSGALAKCQNVALYGNPGDAKQQLLGARSDSRVALDPLPATMSRLADAILAKLRQDAELREAEKLQVEQA
eukprot:1712083-Prymnesium_polylepis.1